MGSFKAGVGTIQPVLLPVPGLGLGFGLELELELAGLGAASS